MTLRWKHETRSGYCGRTLNAVRVGIRDKPNKSTKTQVTTYRLSGCSGGYSFHTFQCSAKQVRKLFGRELASAIIDRCRHVYRDTDSPVLLSTHKLHLHLRKSGPARITFRKLKSFNHGVRNARQPSRVGLSFLGSNPQIGDSEAVIPHKVLLTSQRPARTMRMVRSAL